MVSPEPKRLLPILPPFDFDVLPSALEGMSFDNECAEEKEDSGPPPPFSVVHVSSDGNNNAAAIDVQEGEEEDDELYLLFWYDHDDPKVIVPNYRDWSHVFEYVPTGYYHHQMDRDPSENRANLPIELHDILTKGMYDESVMWLPHGRAISITDTDKFRTTVLPGHFAMDDFDAWLSAALAWGFRRIEYEYETQKVTLYHEVCPTVLFVTNSSCIVLSLTCSVLHTFRSSYGTRKLVTIHVSPLPSHPRLPFRHLDSRARTLGQSSCTEFGDNKSNMLLSHPQKHGPYLRNLITISL